MSYIQHERGTDHMRQFGYLCNADETKQTMSCVSSGRRDVQSACSFHITNCRYNTQRSSSLPRDLIRNFASPNAGVH